ncbi:DUF502 domain-containing protein [Parachitinimonas caeni]|uniref:DUF502 domain-containing protein n=1 Tax=Parachitinimonas caeni TaxID=3031301 RepID=A0ABT7DX84_9NEIS|nr:DUF502 domain-containing protein [Parachitinimonas caeni]MDK2124683.1 DUF502 domain-containing protein [Parachitinimonas caeni]
MKRYFITGLLIWVPLGITLWVISVLVGTLDDLLFLLPRRYQPTEWLGFHIPGFGVILALSIVLSTGLLTANILGQRLVTMWEEILARIPVVKSIYGSVKQVSDTLFSGSGQAFRKALLVRFPHQDAWTIAFLTGSPSGEVASHLGEEHVSVYVPTTPNPTSGYFVLVPKRDTFELEMSVDDALKYVISMGVVAPSPKAAELRLQSGDEHNRKG